MKPSTDAKPNPYQPPSIGGGNPDSSGPTEVTFQLTRPLRRHAEANYLLHWHPNRLLFGSLGLIALSVAVMIFSFRFSSAAFLPTLAGVMAMSAAIYGLLVRQTKVHVRRRLQEHGLSNEEPITLTSDARQTRLVSSTGTYVWPNQRLSIYRTRRGLLICPEPYLFVFVPKRAEVPFGSYKQFVKVMRTRVRDAVLADAAESAG